MPPIPKRDYSVPRPAGPVVDTSKRVEFPTLKVLVNGLLHNLVRHVYPSFEPKIQGAAQPTLPRQRVMGPITTPVPYVNPKWQRPQGHGRPYILDKPGPFRGDN